MLRRGNGARPPGDRERAALELLRRHGSELLGCARRYAATPEDAEDAYQRAVEILLTKAPTTRLDELLPWLKTVMKHEAFAVRRQRDRHTPVGDEGDPPERPAAALTQERAERIERLQQSAEALRRLKPQEVRALLLRAEGYSYREICAITGWTYTKVNRCLTEGRRAFLEQVAGIEAGAECERLAPLLSLMADGEAGASELHELRPHLRTCLSCRARLRDYRSAPTRVAALVPPAAALAADPSGPLRSAAETLVGAVQDRAAAVGERAHAATELATGQKVAAVAASAAAVAGGGATVDQLGDERRAGRPPAAEARLVGDGRGVPASGGLAAPPAPTEPPAADAQATPPAGGLTGLQATPSPGATAQHAPPPAPKPQPPDPADEFSPGGAAPAGSSFEPSGSSGAAGGGGSGGGEFGP